MGGAAVAAKAVGVQGMILREQNPAGVTVDGVLTCFVLHKMNDKVPDFGMVNIPSLLQTWWRNLPSSNQINEWKERVTKASEKLEYLEYNLLELEGKVRKRVIDCQNVEEGKGERLAIAFLLENLRELEDLISENIQPEEGPSGAK